MITAEELFGKHFNGLHYDDMTPERIIKYAIDFAGVHSKEALKQASEKASLKCGEYSSDDFYIDTDSILNAYPLSNIK